MKQLWFSLVFAALLNAPALGATITQNDRTAILTAIDTTNAAFARRDPEAVADLTFDKLMDAIGGRAKYIEALKSSFKTIDAEVVKIVSHKADVRNDVTFADGYYICVVNEVTDMNLRGQNVRNIAFTLAIRKGTEGPWKLIGGNGISQNPRILTFLFAGLPADFKIPETSMKPF